MCEYKFINLHSDSMSSCMFLRARHQISACHGWCYARLIYEPLPFILAN